MVQDLFSKHLAFISLHIVHKIMKKLSLHTFLILCMGGSIAHMFLGSSLAYTIGAATDLTTTSIGYFPTGSVRRCARMIQELSCISHILLKRLRGYQDETTCPWCLAFFVGQARQRFRHGMELAPSIIRGWEMGG